MAYVYYVPPTTVPPPQERPSLCPSPSKGFFCGPALIFLGGAGALMVGFFERKPVIIWPVISFGAILCALGVLLARRQVKRWRHAEQERQRAMWRSNTGQAGEHGSGGAGGGTHSLFDLPMYCLDAPSRPLIRASSPGTSRYGTPGAADSQSYDNEFWFALAIPLKPNEVGDGEYLNWAAMTLVAQPHPKYGIASALAVAGGGGGGGGGGGHGDAGAADVAFDAAAFGILTRTTVARATYSGYTRAADGHGSAVTADASADHASEPMLSAVSLTLVRSPSLGSRSVHNAGGGGGGAGRIGRGSRTSRMGDLLSLFAAVAGGGGVGDDSAARPPEVDENGVELAGIKAMAAQQAAAAAASRPAAPAEASPTLPSPAPPDGSASTTPGSPSPGAAAGVTAAATNIQLCQTDSSSADCSEPSTSEGQTRAGGLNSGVALLSPAAIPSDADDVDAAAAHVAAAAAATKAP